MADDHHCHNSVIGHNVVIVDGVPQVNRPELMDKLVDEAARLLAEHGPAGLSLRKLADAVGVSTMPVYTLFGDKQGLLAAMHREGFRRLGEALSAVPLTADPLPDLMALGMAYRAAALAGPHLYGLMFSHVVPEFSPDTEGLAAAEAAFRPLVDGVERCQQAGVFRPGDAERVALHLWATAHGMVSLELNRQLPDLDTTDLFLESMALAGAPFLAS